MTVQNYQSTFYQTSGETEVEDDEEKLLPMAINVHPSSLNAHRARSNYSKSATNTAAIFPRSTPLSPASYQTSPWLRTLPSQSVRSSTSGAPPPKPVGSSTPANRPPAKAHTEKNTSQPWTFDCVVCNIILTVVVVVVAVVVVVVVIVCFNFNDQCNFMVVILNYHGTIRLLSIDSGRLWNVSKSEY